MISTTMCRVNNRIDTHLARLRSENTAAFIAYVCGGDPDPATSLQILHALDNAGVDIIEIGLPFSDPLADGIVNQLASERALASGANAKGILEMVREFRKTSETPIVLYVYLNNLYAYGYEAFQRDALEAGVDGILNLDLPPDEATANPELHAAEGLRQIRLIAPTTGAERIALIAESAEGFIYYVSREGVTGARSEIASNIQEHIDLIRKASALPIAVGFGISSPEQAAAVARMADAVVVGSAIVHTIAEHAGAPDLVDRLAAIVGPLVKATHAARR
jgi:tryptophan synthase alpha chain